MGPSSSRIAGSPPPLPCPNGRCLFPWPLGPQHRGRKARPSCTAHFCHGPGLRQEQTQSPRSDLLPHPAPASMGCHDPCFWGSGSRSPAPPSLHPARRPEYRTEVGVVLSLWLSAETGSLFIQAFRPAPLLLRPKVTSSPTWNQLWAAWSGLGGPLARDSQL